jgi:hypothetical protein
MSSGARGEVVTHCAVVAAPEQWVEFSLKWREVLVRHGVEHPFHMSQYASRLGQYARFRHNIPEWGALLIDLIAVIKRYIPNVSAATVRETDRCVPKSLQEHPRLWHLANAYTASLAFCLEQFRFEKQEGHLAEDTVLHCVFDSDDRRQDVLDMTKAYFWRYPETFDDSVSFGNTRKHIPIQAADVLAYEAMKRVLHTDHERSGREVRKSAEALFVRNSFYKAKKILPGNMQKAVNRVTKIIGDEGSQELRRR